MRRTSRLIAAGCLLLLAATAAADVIQLKDGRFFEGRIVKEEDGIVTLEMQKYGVTMQITFPRHDVVYQEKKPYPPDGNAPQTQPDQPTPPTTTAPATPASVSGPTLADLDKSDHRADLVRFFRDNYSPLAPCEAEPFAPPISDFDRQMYKQFYQTRVETALGGAPAARAAMQGELLEAMKTVSDRPGLCMLMLQAARDLELKSDNPRDLKRLRDDFARRCHKDNPLHQQALLDWDLAVHAGLSASADAKVRDDAVDAIDGGAMRVAALWLSSGHPDEAVKSLTGAVDGARISWSPLLGDAYSAAKGVSELAKEAKDLDAKLAAGGDENDRKQIASVYLLYAGDYENAKPFLLKIEDPAWAQLNEAAHEKDVIRTDFLLGEGLYALSRLPADKLPAGHLPAYYLRAARLRLSKFAADHRGRSDDDTLAKLRLAQIQGEMEKMGGTRLFGLQTPPDARRIVFVVDLGARCAQLLPRISEELAATIRKLGPAQTFHVIFARDNGTIDLVINHESRLQKSDQKNLDFAADWVTHQSAGKNQTRADASNTAFRKAWDVADGPPEAIFYVTDDVLGRVTVEYVARLAVRRSIPVYVIGLPDSTSERNLGELAQVTKGRCQMVRTEDLGQ
ncbi:MAG: hypothetical protein BIFFINMI_01768 [Phycisphaerae bacterium]|nr:hypothetical protein [Phycisphaerae bacterium]